MSSHYLHFRWENLNNKRYYICVLEHDIFGDLLLTKYYGSINSRNGRIEKQAVSSLKDAVQQLKKLANTRRRHGYTLVSQQLTFRDFL